MAEVVTVFIGLGSNMDDSKNMVQRALHELEQLEGCTVKRSSSLYVTEPVGFEDQSDFVNAVCKIETELSATKLLKELQDIEQTLGKVRPVVRHGPRIIDLDLLMYGEQQSTDDELTLPHHSMHQRRFVLEPLLEIEPQIEIPGKGSAQELLNNCESKRVKRVV